MDTFDASNRPVWTSADPSIMACPICFENDKLVVLGLHKEAYMEFSKNLRRLHCPECGYTSQRWKTRAGVPEQELWIPFYLPGRQEHADGMTVVRPPEFEVLNNGMLLFLDGDDWTERLNVSGGPSSYGTTPEQVKQIIKNMAEQGQ